MKKADKNKFEQDAWQRWLVDYQKMDDKNFVSFKEYLEKLKAPQVQRTMETVEDTFNRLKTKVKKPK